MALKPIVESMGLDWSAQLKRIKNDSVLSEGMAVIATPTESGIQEVICLKNELLNGWLFGIDCNFIN